MAARKEIQKWKKVMNDMKELETENKVCKDLIKNLVHVNEGLKSQVKDIQQKNENLKITLYS